MEKDIKYSVTMWIVGTDTDLSVQNRDRVTGDHDGGWLDDNVIDYCMAVLNNQYHHANDSIKVVRGGLFEGTGCRYVCCTNYQ